MCGVAGFISVRTRLADELASVARAMADTLEHRGPDDVGVWVNPESGVALGHRRLSIVDLSPAGHQPMQSTAGRFIIAFNGEIYNHQDIRADLERSGTTLAWRGHSDTETLLAAIELWGLEDTLRRSVGMFAIALWDRRDRTLQLARDRFGEKPMYYGWVNGAFVFGSELKALRAHPGFAQGICRRALAQYLRYMYVPAPRSIYQGIYKVEPGCILTIRGAPPPTPPVEPLRSSSNYGSASIRRWWSLSDVVEAGAKNLFTDEHEAVEALEESLAEAVRLQLVADVPLGAFLSGGVDSSTIVALMQARASRPVKSFTVGFEEAGFDESPFARAVAKHLGTEHVEVFVSAAEAHAAIGRLPTMYDEPFADSSQIPTHLVCRAARQHVTVALSGDAGDECFGGYNRYFWGPRVWDKLAWLPFPLRRALGTVIAGLPVAGWDALGKVANLTLSGATGVAHFGDKAHKLAARLGCVRDMDDLYLSLVSEWQDPAELVLSDGAPVHEPPTVLTEPLPANGVEDDRLRMMYRDSISYLPDDILCKVDRAAMATSLETRVPFLDHRVAQVAWRMPLHMKIRGNQGKWALRQILYRHVPRTLIERPKSGFGIPVGNWLRGPLRPWAESLLEESRIRREGYLDPAPIREAWSQHLGGTHDWTPKLWSILMFQAWLESNS